MNVLFYAAGGLMLIQKGFVIEYYRVGGGGGRDGKVFRHGAGRDVGIDLPCTLFVEKHWNRELKIEENEKRQKVKGKKWS